MTQGKVYRTSKFKEKNPRRFENNLKGRLSKKQLKAKIIYRKRDAKLPKNLGIDNYESKVALKKSKGYPTEDV